MGTVKHKQRNKKARLRRLQRNLNEIQNLVANARSRSAEGLQDNKWTWAASGVSIVGAFLMASNTGVSKYSFPCFLFGSSVYLVFARRARVYSLCVVEFTFVLANLLGIYQWLF